jgi:hypothetical protein
MKKNGHWNDVAMVIGMLLMVVGIWRLWVLGHDPLIRGSFEKLGWTGTLYWVTGFIEGVAPWIVGMVLVLKGGKREVED